MSTIIKLLTFNTIQFSNSKFGYSVSFSKRSYITWSEMVSNSCFIACNYSCEDDSTLSNCVSSSMNDDDDDHSLTHLILYIYNSERFEPW